MKIQSKLTVIMLVFGLMFATSAISNYNFSNDYENSVNNIEIQDEINLRSPKIAGGYFESFIHIDGSIPNNWSATASSKVWCSGNGSWSNPYIIENVTIDASSSPTESGIYIENSKNEYFIIRNCTVFAAGSGTFDGGIKLENTNNGTLFMNNCSLNNQNGILLYEDCNNNTISGNTANDNLPGISLYNGCDNNTISGNTANGNFNGICLYNGCDNNTISGNTAWYNWHFGKWHWGNGIYLEENCTTNTISGNNANDNFHGISLHNGCDNNTISGNTANEYQTNGKNGIFLNNSDYNIISGNTANNNDDYGIYLNNDCDNNIISGNTANDNNEYGIYLNNDCDNNTISGNTIIDNTQYGIRLYYYCNNNNITQNYIYYNILGAILINTADCDNTLIKTNVLVSRDTLFILDSGTNTMKKANYYGTTPPSFVIEVSDQSFSTTEFIITINVSSQCTGLEVFNFSIQLSWNGTAVPSNNITELDNGLYKISLTPILVELDENPISLNMTFTAAYHNDKYYEINITVEPKPDDVPPVIIANLLFIEIKNQTFSKEEFNVAFYVHNREYQGIIGADIQMWWNGVNVSSNVVELENGLYNTILTPLFTELGEEPILLNMSIKAIGYPDKYFET